MSRDIIDTLTDELRQSIQVGDKGTVLADLYGECAEIITKAYQAGRDAGLELAAKRADGADTLVEGTYQPDHPRVAQRIAMAIRALKEKHG